MIKSEIKNLLLKITIKVLKMTLAIEKITNMKTNKLYEKLKKCEEISGKIVNFIVFLVTYAILLSDICHFTLSDVTSLHLRQMN
jgi:hypothetical protein